MSFGPGEDTSGEYDESAVSFLSHIFVQFSANFDEHSLVPWHGVAMRATRVHRKVGGAPVAEHPSCGPTAQLPRHFQHASWDVLA